MRKVQFVKNHFYHIFNRGVEKRTIFLNDSDRWRFLQGLFLFNDEESSANLLWQLERDRGAVNFRVLKDFFATQTKSRHPLVRIMADCLMPNHYHLLLEEVTDGGISRFMHKLGTGYTQYFNKKYERVGSLLQGPFKAVLVDDDMYLKYLLVYINAVNPSELCEAKLSTEIEEIMRFAEEFPWATHQEYVGKRNSIIIDKGLLGKIFPGPEIYQEFAKEVLLGKKYETAKHLFFE